MRSLALDELTEVPSVDVALATAVPIERDEMLSHMRPAVGHDDILKVAWAESTYYIGRCGRYGCALLLCEQGAEGRGASTMAIADAIMRLAPRAVILVGIAFGSDPGKQVIGDVLVSTMIIPYELQRVGREETVPKSPHPPAGQTLLDRVRNLGWAWTDGGGTARRPILGAILSGEKLVDNSGFKAELFRRHPNAIGGEMEGAGLFAAADRRRVEWLIVKAICDWGEGKTDCGHALAARNACAMVADLLHEPGIVPDAAEAVRTPAEKAMRETARAMALGEVRREIRSTGEAMGDKAEQLAAVLQPYEGSSTMPEGDRKRAQLLFGERLVAEERWLNAYEDGCAKYLAGDVEPALLRATFAGEIRELIDTTGPHSPRLHPRVTSAYKAIWSVYDEVSAAQAS